MNTIISKAFNRAQWVISLSLFLFLLGLNVNVNANSRTWTSIAPRIAITTRDPVFSPSNPDIIYIVSNIGLLKSIDRGQQWDIVNKNINLNTTSLSISETDPQSLTQLVQYDFDGASYTSKDGGLSWLLAERNAISIKTTPLFDFPNKTETLQQIDNALKNFTLPITGALSVAQNDSSTLYFVSNTSSEGFYKSTNAGKSWAKISQPNPQDRELGNVSCSHIAINPKNSQDILCASYNNQPQHIPLCSSKNTLKTYLYRSIDAGSSWVLIKNDSRPPFCPDGTSYPLPISIYLHYQYGNNGEVIYYQEGANLRKSTDNGANWLDITIKGITSYPAIEKLIVDPQDSNIIFSLARNVDGGGSNIVYKSIDGGESWINKAEFSPTAFPDPFVDSLFIHPFNSNRLIYKATNFISITDDGGDSWRELPIEQWPEPVKHAHHYIFNPRNSDGLFVLAQEGGVAGKIYETKNLGLSWNLIHTEQGINSLLTFSDKIYASSANETGSSIEKTDTLQMVTENNSTKTMDCIFKWAELKYPGLFNAPASQSIKTENYTYRHYVNSNSYLGFFQDKKIHLLQANSSNDIKDVGFTEYYQYLAGCADD